MKETGGNPERMRPTRASHALIVREANEILFQVAKTIVNTPVSKDNTLPTVRAAELFLKEIK